MQTMLPVVGVVYLRKSLWKVESVTINFIFMQPVVVDRIKILLGIGAFMVHVVEHTERVRGFYVKNLFVGLGLNVL